MKCLFLVLTPLGQEHLLRHNKENADDDTLKTCNGSTCLYTDTSQFKDALRVLWVTHYNTAREKQGPNLVYETTEEMLPIILNIRSSASSKKSH